MTADSYAQKVETVARALHKRNSITPWERATPPIKEGYREDARAALAAYESLHPETADAGACGCVPGDCAAEADGQPCGRAPAPAISGGEMVSVLKWIAAFATVRSQDDSKVFARVNRGAMRTIAEKAYAALAAAGQKP